MFFCIIIKRKVIRLRNAPNDIICESASSDITDWNSVNWDRVEKYVDKQQKRIYKAEVENRHRDVRNIQRRLTRSKAVILLAVRRVTNINKGRKTAGIDGFRALSDKAKGKLVEELLKGDIYKHKPKPTLRKYIPKKNGKKRALGIPTIKDRIYQEITRMILEPQAEANFEPISYGFRPKRGVFDAIGRIHNNIAKNNWCWVYEGDFRACFDNLSHEFILKKIKGFPLYNLVERFLKAGYVDNNVFNKTDRGTPQGGLLSPLLANIALTGLEEYLNITYREQSYTNKNGEKKITYVTTGKYRVVRYADDFVIFAKTREDIEKIPNILEPYLEERGLELAEEKTNITHTHDGFNFLGFNCRLYKTDEKYKCLIKPSKDSIKKTKEKINYIFEISKGDNVDTLIDRLNPVINGIGYFWRIVVAKKTFNHIDFHIWNKTKRFLKRLHPHKSWKWIINKYFPLYDDGKHHNKWILTGPNDKNRLNKMAYIPIRRWNMIKYNYSPYDASKKEYFKNRMMNKYH